MPKRLWFRLQRKPGGGDRAQLGLALFLGLLLAFLLIRWFNASLRPQLVALTEAQIRNYLTQAANQSLSRASELGLSYQDMVTLKTGDGDEPAMLTTDTLRLNQLRAAVLDDIIIQADSLDSHSLSVPLGALTGIDLLSALGPKLPVKVVSVASVDGAFRNDFLSAGINQTLHRVMLDVTMAARLLLPGGVVEVTVSVPICVAETVIIGQVPQTYVGLNK